MYITDKCFWQRQWERTVQKRHWLSSSSDKPFTCLTFHCSLMYTLFSVMRKIQGQNVNTGSIGTASSQIHNSVLLILVSKTLLSYGQLLLHAKEGNAVESWLSQTSNKSGFHFKCKDKAKPPDGCTFKRHHTSLLEMLHCSFDWNCTWSTCISFSF